MSREIDALVAEKVMGWGHAHGVKHWTLRGEYMASERYSPSTNIADAIDIFESLGPGWQLNMSDPSGYEDCFRWWCWLPVEYGGVEPKDRECETMEATAPMAICIAALKDAGVDVDALLAARAGEKTK